MVQDRVPFGSVKAVHWIIIYARMMAYEKAAHDRIAGILDHAEYLLTLIFSDDDQTDWFREYLEGTATRYQCMHAVELFEGPSA